MSNHQSGNKNNRSHISEVPEGWKLKRLKYLTKPKKELSETGEEELLSVTETRGIIKRRDLKSADEPLSRSDDLIGYRLVEEGNLVNNIMLVWKRGLGVSPYSGIVSPAYSVFSFSKECDPWYFNYLLRSEEYITEFRRNSTGITMSRLRLYDDSFGDVFGILPLLTEQKLISRYLDKKTSQIDSLISKIEQKIELLKEQRTLLINQYVTKGIKPNVEMKDSGVEWICEIPKHWKTKKIKYLGSIKSGEGITSSELNEDGEFPVYGGNGIVGFHTMFNLEQKAIIIGRVGEKCGNIHLVDSRSWISDNSLILNLLSGENFYWVSLCLETRDLNKLRNQSSQPLITGTHVKNENIPYPPPNEMKDISEYIQKKSLNIDSDIRKSLKKIELLKEYRQSLISFTVTGKLRVTEEMV
jgi:type I restriction enzyme S subunit